MKILWMSINFENIIELCAYNKINMYEVYLDI
jgi:hypothetical protein